MTEGKPATASASRIAIALPSADSDVSGTRSMLQERIGLWAMWVCVLSSTFYIVNIVAWPLVASTSGVLDMLVHRGPMLHLVASVWFGSVWLLTRTKQLSLQALRVLDLATLIIGCGLYAWMGNGLARAQEMVGYAAVVGVYTGLLAATSVVVSRAITVPSTAARTFWASIIAMLPIGIVAWITTGVPADSV
ncbi:MAG TPA: hypothetical protein VFO52_05155, partial [Longimicrobiales bacterium]|nr:hypothetical protein [Longimicrobiales bacterium]